MIVSFEEEERLQLAEDTAVVVLKKILPLFKNIGYSENDKLMSVDDLIKYLGVTRDWVYHCTTHKKIPHIKMGKHLKFRKKEIDAWLETNKVPVSDPVARVRFPGGMKRIK